jgi:chemotaxis protein CheC
LIFPEARSLELVRSILGDEHSIEDILNLEHEVLAETGNIILNACLSTIGNVLHRNIRMSLPSVVRGNGATLFAAREGDGKAVFFLHIRFIIRRHEWGWFHRVADGVTFDRGPESRRARFHQKRRA